VFGFAFGRRHRATLALCWSDVPMDYQDKLIVTDGYGAYTSFFAPDQHCAIDKGDKEGAGKIGQTSIVESLNTKWRQRQSGLVRRSCGVSRRIETDLVERFFLLVEQHNLVRQRLWERGHKTVQSGQ
jgi:IS1 family transposase